jgi:hypothetical protein
MKIALKGFRLVPLFAVAATCASGAEPSSMPKRFNAYVDGFMGASYAVELHDGVLSYTAPGTGHSNPKNQTIAPTTVQWRQFRRTLNDLNVWRWRTTYPSRGVADGTQWSLDIAYPDRALHAKGDNNFPDDTGKENREPEPTKAFSRFLAAVQELLGGKTFQ